MNININSLELNENNSFIHLKQLRGEIPMTLDIFGNFYKYLFYIIYNILRQAVVMKRFHLIMPKKTVLSNYI